MQIDVLKASRSQRHNSYYGLRKNRIAPRTLPAIRSHAPLEFFARKRWSRSRLFGTPEKKGHPNRSVEARSASGPSKNTLQERFLTNNHELFLNSLSWHQKSNNSVQKATARRQSRPDHPTLAIGISRAGHFRAFGFLIYGVRIVSRELTRRRSKAWRIYIWVK